MADCLLKSAGSAPPGAAAAPAPTPATTAPETPTTTSTESSGKFAKTTMVPAEFESSSEYANYFCEYAKIYHQKDMLEDVKRMRAYHGAIVGNKECFKGKVVLDLGTGTGVLAMWAAQAGAKKVYAVEATAMANHARTLVKANGLGSVVEVIQSKVENLTLPTKVDIIVSEWMGYLLLRESMLDSVIYARDKFLKDGGALYPSHACLCWGGLVHEYGHEENMVALDDSMADWKRFQRATKADFNLDMSALSSQFKKENREYYLNRAYYCNLRGDQVVAQNVKTTEFDINTITVSELRVIRENFSMNVSYSGELTALACWFATDFRGGKDCPTKRLITLDTAPGEGYSHWGQQVFYLSKQIQVAVGDSLKVSTVIERHKENDRMVHCTMGLAHTVAGATKPSTVLPKRLFHID